MTNNLQNTLSKPSLPAVPRYRDSLLQRGLFLVAATIATSAWLVMAGRILSDVHPIWDLASHLSFHMWILTSIATVVSLIGLRTQRGESRIRWWHRCIMLLPPWLYFCFVTTPWHILPLTTNSVDAKGLKIFAWNIWISNKSPDQVLEVIRKSNADVVALIELGSDQARVLKQLESEYPHTLWMPEESARGIAILSRVAETRFRVINLADQGMPAIEADIPASDQHAGYRVLAVHTRSPDLHQRTLDRNQQLQSLAEWAMLPAKPGIIVGDLNITPWSPPFTRLLNRGNLTDSRKYRGYFASWPTDLGIFAIPIDHALVANGIEVLYREVGERAPDSDHRPIALIVK